MSSVAAPANPTIHVGLILNTKDGKSTNLRVIPFILNTLTGNIDTYILNSIKHVVGAAEIARRAQHKDATTANITGPNTFAPAIFFNPNDYSITEVTYKDSDGSIVSDDPNLKLVKIIPDFVKTLTGISNSIDIDFAEKILLVTTVLKYIYDTLKSEQKNLNLTAQQNIDRTKQDKFTSEFKKLIDEVKKSPSFNSNLKDVSDAISEVEYMSFYPNDDSIPMPIVTSPETATDQESIKELYTLFTHYLKAIEEDKLRSQLGGGFKNRKSRRRISKNIRKSKRRISKRKRSKKSKKRRKTRK